jgi:hypothetical protein
MATNTVPSFTDHTGNGNTDSNGKSDAFPISFAYLAESEIDVTVGTDFTPKTQGTHYEFASGTTIKFLSGHVPANGVAIKFQRDTDISAKKIDFQDGSVLTEADLDTQSDQILFGLQEFVDKVNNDLLRRDGSNTIIGSLQFEGSGVDDFETTLSVTNPTADRTITFPNADGNVVLDTLAQTLTNKTITATAFTSSNVDINGGAIDGTPIGANSASTGAFTTGTIATANTTNLTNTQKLKVNSATTSDDGDGTYTLTDGFITLGTNDTNALQLFHDSGSNNSFVSEVGTGDLVIVTNGTNLFLQKDATSGHAEDFIQCIANGAVRIFHDSQPKLTTLTNGIEITGNVDLDGITGAGVVTSGTSSSDTQVYSAKRAEERFYGKDTLGEIQSGETWSSADDKVATTAAIDARVIDLVDDVGGFVPIANETSFPNANPDVNNGTGTLVSVPLANNLTSNSSGVISIANGTVGNSTVTITGATASSTFAQGFGIIVETTSTLNTYTFHRYVPKATEVTTVATNISNVNTTATNIGNVNSVGGNITNVNAVAGNATNINSAVSNASNINTVAGSISNVNDVGSNISNVNAVSNNESNINIVAGNNSNVSTVAGISGNVTTVAGISGNVTTAANNATVINTVAGSITNVNNVGGAIGNVASVAASLSNVNTVAGDIANVNTVAGNNSNINTVAGNNTNITTVANNNSNITAVAQDATDIGNVAASIANVNTTAANIANVNSVGGNISNVNTVATNLTPINTAATYLNDFQALYLGAASSAPVTDGVGNAVTEGDLYFNSVNKQMQVYNGNVFTSIFDTALDFAKLATAAFNALYTASAGSNSIDLGGLAITGAAFSNEAVATNRVSLTKGSVTYNLGGI